MDMLPEIDGFWLPKNIRSRLLSAATEYATLSFASGRPCPPNAPGAVIARWPVLSEDEWQSLLALLRENRRAAPTGPALWRRLARALKTVGDRFGDPADPLRRLALDSLPGYTGYSPEMLQLTLGALELFDLDQMPAAFACQPAVRSAWEWQPIPGLPGRLRFFYDNSLQSWLARLPGRTGKPLHSSQRAPEFMLGYGAGNVPGTALLIALLSLSTTLTGSAPPVLIVKNSRREPIFSPLVLQALEQADPDLVSTIAVLVWDYEDAGVQDRLLAQADLALVAASDETIAQVKAQSAQSAARSGRSPRFHAHGHKVSFSAIGKEMFAPQLDQAAGDPPWLFRIALLAALDSVFWDQYGCLSARVHFVETGDGDPQALQDYTAHLQSAMRLLQGFLPRGAWPLQHLHDRFDRYKMLETTGLVQVFSRYEDEFLLVCDSRPLSAQAFHSQVNDCQGRVVIVRPVAELMEIPQRYLRMIPAANLQSLSVAVGKPGQGLSERFLRFAAACARCGVTAIRTVGRGAFPQLAYSWDGLLPLDLVRPRPAGRFATIEFDAPYEEIQATWQLLQERAAFFHPAAIE